MAEAGLLIGRPERNGLSKKFRAGGIRLYGQGHRGTGLRNREKAAKGD